MSAKNKTTPPPKKTRVDSTLKPATVCNIIHPAHPILSLSHYST